MAIQSWTVCSTTDASIGITYDDVSNQIQTVVLTNNQGRGTVTVELRSFSDDSLIDTISRNFGTGTFTRDVTARNWQVTTSPSPKPGGGVIVGLPVRVICVWS